jgi:hypothetical protein
MLSVFLKRGLDRYLVIVGELAASRAKPFWWRTMPSTTNRRRPGWCRADVIKVKQELWFSETTADCLSTIPSFTFHLICLKGKMLDIHILGEGPFSRDEALKLTSSSDYGLYQFYGDHLVYGRDVLLYLGKAETQTFGRCISQHNWEMWTASPATIYVGKICSATPLELDEWIKQINLSERIILQSHLPCLLSG